MTTFFSKPMDCSIEFACPMDQTPDRTYPILETFPRRFGGVGAPEGREIAPDILIQHFSPNQCFWLFITAEPGPAEKYNIFLQNIQKISPKHTKLFSRIQKTGGANLRLSTRVDR